eukprot:4320764-Amphidinium_carterae.1
MFIGRSTTLTERRESLNANAHMHIVTFVCVVEARSCQGVGASELLELGGAQTQNVHFRCRTQPDPMQCA